MSRNKGSLSTILAGVLVLIALLMGIGIAITVLSTIITLENMAANHVNTVGRAAATYSGLITQGNILISTKGPVTIIGEVTPSGFRVINLTSYEYASNGTGPELLLTNVGPIMLDPTQQTSNDAPQTPNQVSAYLYHWVAIVVNEPNYATPVANPYEPNAQNVPYTGAVINLTNGYYIISLGWPYTSGTFSNSYVTRAWPPIGPPGIPYIVGPLNNTNSYVLADYGYGHYACTYIYPDQCPPLPPGGSNFLYTGNDPTVAMSQGTIQITIPNGTQYYEPPTEIVIYILDANTAQFTNEYLIIINNNGKIIYYPFKPTVNYQIINTTITGGEFAKQLTPIQITIPAPTSNNYYIIMTIWEDNVQAPPWFTWHVINNQVKWPAWLNYQQTIITTPQQYNNP